MVGYVRGEGALAGPTWDEQVDGDDRLALDRRLRERSVRMARDDYELGLLLRRGFVLKVHEIGGFGSFREYAEHLFGFSARQTEERLRVAEALERLPGLSVELAQGRIRWSVARELARVATEENELEWIEAAENKTAREGEALVSGRMIGDAPDTPVKTAARNHPRSVRA